MGGGREREGGAAARRWRSSQGCRPPSPSLVYIGRTNGLLSHRPISNSNAQWSEKDIKKDREERWMQILLDGGFCALCLARHIAAALI